MFSKAIALLAFVACVSGGFVGAPAPAVYQQAYAAAVPAATYVHDSPHIGRQSEQTVRGFAGSSVSHQQKAIDSAFSSVRKTDTRITNPALYAAAPVYAQPQQVYAAQPQVAYQSAAYAAPVATYGAQPVAYGTQTYSASPVVKAVAAPAAVHYKTAAPVAAYSAPVYAAQPAIAKVAHQPLLGVAYSAVSPAVATLNFNGYGISYGY